MRVRREGGGRGGCLCLYCQARCLSRASFSPASENFLFSSVGLSFEDLNNKGVVVFTVGLHCQVAKARLTDMLAGMDMCFKIYMYTIYKYTPIYDKGGYMCTLALTLSHSLSLTHTHTRTHTHSVF
jgi:hypothetical protein